MEAQGRVLLALTDTDKFISNPPPGGLYSIVPNSHLCYGEEAIAMTHSDGGLAVIVRGHDQVYRCPDIWTAKAVMLMLTGGQK